MLTPDYVASTLDAGLHALSVQATFTPLSGDDPFTVDVVGMRGRGEFGDVLAQGWVIAVTQATCATPPVEGDVITKDGTSYTVRSAAERARNWLCDVDEVSP